MRILAFETSAKAASAALLEDGRLVAEAYQNSGLTHSRTVLAMAEGLLGSCQWPAASVDAVAVASGPGSFTGVRIGVAAAKGFAWARELPCCGVSTLEAMAWGAGLTDGILVAAMDARRSQVYAAAFQMEGGVPRRLLEDSALAVAELGERLAALPGPKTLCGDGACLCHEALGPVLGDLTLLPEHRRLQRAAGVGLAAWARLQAGERPDGAALVPTYLRLSQAERERLERLTRGEA